VTDLPSGTSFVPSRLGTRLALDGDVLVGRLEPPPSICGRGAISMAAVVFFVDVVAGVTVDDDPGAWAFTSDLSVRLPLGPPPPAIDGQATVLRTGRRSATCEVPLVVEGRLWGTSYASFARVPTRPDDPPKPAFDPDTSVNRIGRVPLDEPLRSAAGFETLDAVGGVVRVALRPELLNPAGALQGAMVAGLAEAAAEDLADHHLGTEGGPHVVTEIDVRYLVQNRTATITSRAWFVGDPDAGVVRVDLVDDDGRRTTAVTARVRPFA
jgi:acyl-coenzyme A thioesterase PaaI-like protein